MPTLRVASGAPRNGEVVFIAPSRIWSLAVCHALNPPGCMIASGTIQSATPPTSANAAISALRRVRTARTAVAIASGAKRTMALVRRPPATPSTNAAHAAAFDPGVARTSTRHKMVAANASSAYEAAIDP